MAGARLLGPAVVLVAALSGCGGGQSGGSTPASSNLAPEVEIISPPAGASFRETLPPLVFRVSGGEARVLVDGLATSLKSGDDLPSLGEGSHSVVVEARDGAGRTSSAGVSFAVDRTPPTVSISSPPAGTTEERAPRLAYTVTGTASVAVTLDGVPVAQRASEYLDPLPNGPHTLRLEATDPAGNVGRAEVSFEVDAPALVSGRIALAASGLPRVLAESEPNDAVLAANSLGSLTTAQEIVVTGNVAVGGEADCFWVVEPTPQEVTVSLDYEGEGAVGVRVYDVLPDGSVSEIGRAGGPGPVELTYETPPRSGGKPSVTAVVVQADGLVAYRLSLAAATLGAAEVAENEPRSLLRRRGVGGAVPPEPSTVWHVPAAAAGEYLVRLKESGREMGRAAVEPWGDLRIVGSVTELALVLRTEESAAPSARSTRAPGGSKKSLGRLLRLRADPRVEQAVPNFLAAAAAAPNDPLYGQQWHVPLLSLNEAWRMTTGSSSVVVAVLDSGIKPHPELDGRREGGYDFIGNAAGAGDGNGIDADPTDRAADSHGTSVAGVIAAAANNGAGIAGIDWNARILPIRVLGTDGYGTLSDILNGLRYAAGLANPSGTLPARKAQIINLSLGGEDPTGQAAAFARPVFDAVRAAGALVIASTGNEGSAVATFPSNVPGVVGVGALSPSLQPASYSNHGAYLDLVAPVGDFDDDPANDVDGDGRPDGTLVPTVVGGAAGYEHAWGTSFAAPMVAGVAALCKGLFPTMPVSTLEEVLQASARDLGAPGRDDRFGYGMVRAAHAVQATLDRLGAPVLDLAQIVHFAADQSQQTLPATNAGTGTLVLTGLETSTADGQGWLTAAIVGGASVRLSVSRTGLATGSYEGRVVVASNGGEATIFVTLAVGEEETDVGPILVRLVDSRTGQVAEEVEASEANGYRYEFVDPPSGTFRIEAGTDPDRDGVLCEGGDFCGSYPAEVAVTRGAVLSEGNLTLTYAPPAPGAERNADAP